MSNKGSRIILEEQYKDFIFQKNKSNLNISFNRIAFIFFIFFVVSIIYTVHLMHLGSRVSESRNVNKFNNQINNLFRADILEANDDYIGKTISSIDIGISPSKIIDKKKISYKLKIYFSR